MGGADRATTAGEGADVKGKLKGLLAIGALILLPACSTKPVWLENRAACTLGPQEGQKQLHALSRWGWFSIGTQLSDADAEVVCAR